MTRQARTSAHAQERIQREFEVAAERVLTYLRRRDSPLVLPRPDGVLVCKEGVHVHGKNLAEALNTLERRITERRSVK